MNYPVWELYYTGGGFLIALIAVVHVYVAHFAVGGGFFLVITEMKGLKERSPQILEYTKSHAKFFLLVTMVFSSVTGVGIWFVISLVSPAATSVLIHTFVFGFAMEWVFFTLEIVAIFIYFYTFGKIEDRAHLTIGWLYGIFALISLVLINGIISFMLTPGTFFKTLNFWDGFFNPGFFPSMFFRITIALVLAGIFGFVTSVFIKDANLRSKMVVYCAKWLVFPFLFMLLSAWWYFSSLDPVSKAMILGRSPELILPGRIFLTLLPVLFISALLMAMRMPEKVEKPMAFFILFTGLVYMGSFEFVREAGRRPYLIPGYLYSNSIKVEDQAKINQQGFLKVAKWVKIRKINNDNAIKAGKEIFNIQCASCHSIGGPLNNILDLTEKFTVFAMEARLRGQGKLNDYMPEFMGTKQERLALARYIVEKLNKHAAMPEKPKFFKEKPVDIPGFDEKRDQYILLAWADPDKSDKLDPNTGFIYSRPRTRISAQLIRRGEIPEIITRDIEFVSDTGKAPLITVKAKDTKNGNILAKTMVYAPEPAEMGCRKCHGSSFSKTSSTPRQVADDILAVHDEISRTKLVNMTEKKGALDCKSCHSVSDSEQLNLSASIHGFHAVYLKDMGSESCNACHTSFEHTQSLSGVHNDVGLDCTNCHGNLEDHALSLLAGREKSGKKSALKLIKHIFPTKVDSIRDIKSRKPWINQVDCLSCHVDFEQPEIDETFNIWTKSEDELYSVRADDGGIRCRACHGTVHALYPASTESGSRTDNIQPLQYQKNRYPLGSNGNCKVCHTTDMEDEMHHPNILTMFRN